MFQFEALDRQTAEEILHVPTPAEVQEAYDEPYRLSEEQIAQYNRDGFIRLRNVLGGNALAYARRVIRAAVLLRKEHDKRALKDKSQYEQSFLQCGYLCWDFPAIKDYVFAKRFAGIARDLMRETHMRLWHDQALFKEPHGRQTDVHQDSSYWPVSEPLRTITHWLALNDVSEDKGCLHFFPGTHTDGIREYVDIFKDPHQPQHLKEIQAVSQPLNAGDATYHSGLTFHGAGANRTDSIREGMTVIYIAEGTTFDAGDERNATHTSCVGLVDGERIDTKFTPVLI